MMLEASCVLLHHSCSVTWKWVFHVEQPSFSIEGSDAKVILELFLLPLSQTGATMILTECSLLFLLYPSLLREDHENTPVVLRWKRTAWHLCWRSEDCYEYIISGSPVREWVVVSVRGSRLMGLIKLHSCWFVLFERAGCERGELCVFLKGSEKRFAPTWRSSSVLCSTGRTQPSITPLSHTTRE